MAACVGIEPTLAKYAHFANSDILYHVHGHAVKLIER